MTSRGFLADDYILGNEWARKLYFEYAEKQPIFDYHCHLPPDEIARNRRFENLTRIWLVGDHYKWRAMRAWGIPEKDITGDTDDFGKFLAFSRVAPDLVRNPLHHWSHLELRRYFGIDLLINESNAPEIWKRANERLSDPDLSVRGILRKFKVSVVCTSDDPVDDLASHAEIAAGDLPTRVYPTFRPDNALRVDLPAQFIAWCDQLGNASSIEIKDFATFLAALKQRHDYFHSLGCRLSDHGMECIPFVRCSEKQAAEVFSKACAGKQVSKKESESYATFVLLYLGRLDAAAGWTKQLHLGAIRDNNNRLQKLIGEDAGFDSVGDFAQARNLSHYLNELDSSDELPRIVLYNVNPADNYVLATMCGNFASDGIAGKMQFGSAWWFLDQKDGMEMQINTLSQVGLLSQFVGMLTDSRSFMSYVRHEYFRRILCNLIGRDVEQGLIPADEGALGKLVRDICFDNAAGFLGLEHGET